MLTIKIGPFPVLSTERLVLREVMPEDADDVLELRSNDEVLRYLGRPKMYTIAEAQRYISLLRDGVAGNQAITWAISRAGDAALIGTIGFWRIEKENHRAEIGYALHPGHWRKGYLSEAMEPVLRFGFDVLKLHSIEARVHPENEASAGLLRKHGFVQEAYFKESFLFEGKFEDSVVYSLLEFRM